MLNLTPFLSSDWFTDAFIKLLVYPCYILTQCGMYFATALFLQFAFNTLISIYRSFTVRNLLSVNKSLLYPQLDLFFWNHHSNYDGCHD